MLLPLLVILLTITFLRVCMRPDIDCCQCSAVQCHRSDRSCTNLCYVQVTLLLPVVTFFMNDLPNGMPAVRCRPWHWAFQLVRLQLAQQQHSLNLQLTAVPALSLPCTAQGEL